MTKEISGMTKEIKVRKRTWIQQRIFDPKNT
jgi:hypothetical protein